MVNGGGLQVGRVRSAAGIAALLASGAVGVAGGPSLVVVPVSVALLAFGGVGNTWRLRPALAARGKSGLWLLALAGHWAYAMIACAVTYGAGRGLGSLFGGG